MPMFKITTTTVSYLEIDLCQEDDIEAFADAVSENGEIDPDALISLLENDISDPHDNLDVIRDSQNSEAVLLSDAEVKAVKENQ